MITSLSWLKNHLNTKANLNQVAERLTEIGLEVENIKSSNINLDSFIICKIIKAQKHPNADKLQLCDVDIGSGNLVKVVCGAKNARAELFTLFISNDPYPNSAEVISSVAINKAAAAGKLKNKLNSKDLFWIKFILVMFLLFIYLERLGNKTVPIAIPAIAKFIW